MAMQVTDSGLVRKTSLRGRPPLPQGPRTRTHGQQPSIGDSPPSSWSFPPPAFSIGTGATPASPTSPTLTSPVSQSSLSPLVVSPVQKTTALTPPPPLSFDPPPLPHKGLPLSVALWTFTSKELQDIVSRAIKLSARESYIRLLSLNSLDELLPQESERLSTLQKVTQAKYRFHVQRRTMLLQALNSFSLTFCNKGSMSPIGKKPSKDDATVLDKLVSQLLETTTAMDTLTTDLITIASHQSQISSLIATHWGSALAVALRKLNKSYARRTKELEDAAQRIVMLEAEVSEAWTEADRLAGEMDELEQFADRIKVSAPTTVQTPVTPPRSASPARQTTDVPRIDIDLTCRTDDLADFLDDEGEAVIKTAAVVRLSPVTEPTTPAFPHFTDTDIMGTPTLSPAPTIRRKHSSDVISTRSAPSISSRRARVSAAKTRSRRASLASLRLPNAHSRRGSRPGSSVGHTLEDDALPPLPIMTESLAKIAKAAMSPKSARRRSEAGEVGKGVGNTTSFISFGSRHGTEEGDGMEIEIVPRRKVEEPPPIPTMWLESDIGRPSASIPQPTSLTTSPVAPCPSTGSTTNSTTSLFRNTSTRTKQKIRTLFRHGSETFLRRRFREAGGSNPSEFELVPDDDTILDGFGHGGIGHGTPRAMQSTVTIMPSTEPPRSILSNIGATTHARSLMSSAMSSVTVENVAISPSRDVKRNRTVDKSRLTRLKTATKRYAFALPIFKGSGSKGAATGQ